jgi:hypothetical protein
VEKTATDDSWVGVRIVAMVGQDARWIHSAGLFDAGGTVSGGEDFDLTDAYLTVKVPEKVFPFPTTFWIGKFETTHGAEVISSVANLNYSRSYLFGYAIPFTHTGVMANTTWVKRGDGELLGTGFGVVNGWDNVKDNNSGKGLMPQIRFNPCDEFETHAEGIFGPEQDNTDSNWRGLVDWNATLTPFARAPEKTFLAGLKGLSFTGNLDYGWEEHAALGTGAAGYAKWYGIAGYVKYVPPCECLKNWYLGFRGEWFKDQDGARTTSVLNAVGLTEAAYWELTTTLAYRPFDNLLVRGEYRYDRSDESVFAGHTSGTSNNLQTFAVDLVVTY